jgi:CRISPR-associated endonuclease/helicase Cas3
MAEWERLADHLAAVEASATRFADAFGWGPLGGIAGRLHDIGKCSRQFQSYIADTTKTTRGGDHSTAGARVAMEGYPKGAFGKMLAFAIAGHHAGLADAESLHRRLLDAKLEPDLPWREVTAPLPPGLTGLQPMQRSPRAGFAEAMRIRMLFSCLVDADFLETEIFYARAEDRPVERGGHTDLVTLRDRLRIFMAEKRAAAPPSRVNTLRNEVLDHAISRAAADPGLFTLTVPTGGGKTLASLSFALEHAVHHAANRGIRRVIYVIPFTSIIEQTAAVFREALDSTDDVLEHHTSVDWDDLAGDHEGRDGAAKLRRAAENWDAPVVVTTAVQFFESLFANRTQRCRKLHNLAGSVIVLDEAQTLPLQLLHPCVAAIDELARNYRASVVLCTATQPALRCKDCFVQGLDIDDSRELAPAPEWLYAELRRVRIERLDGNTTDADIAVRFAEQPRMLCVVNSRAHARTLFDAIRHLPGRVHLTTLMCPRHRRIELARLRKLLVETDEPVRLVATSLIEAGVDIDFPEVWRAVAGLDSIAQAAGRCNREGRPGLGRVVVFEPAEAKPPRALAAFTQATEAVMRGHADPLTLQAVQDYFAHVYWQKGDAALDAATINNVPGILRAIEERATTLDFPFESIADAFRMMACAAERNRKVA